MSESEVKIVVDELRSSPRSVNKENEKECEVCFESKDLECFYTFRCKHSICKMCYSKLKDKDRCCFCRQEIVDEEVVKKFVKMTQYYYLMMLFDMFFTVFIYLWTRMTDKILLIIFFVEMMYVLIVLPFLLIRCGFEVPPLFYNILICALKMAWIITLFVIKIEVWKGIVSSSSKVVFVGMVMMFEYYRNRKEMYYFH